MARSPRTAESEKTADPSRFGILPKNPQFAGCCELADGGYTYFGRFFDRLLESRGYNQSTFAAECRRRGFKVGRPGTQRDIGQRSVSDWMRGYAACPREVPTYADAILVLSEEEWGEFGAAYAYGQTVPEEEFEDLLEFRKFYRPKLAGVSDDGAEKSRAREYRTGAPPG